MSIFPLLITLLLLGILSSSLNIMTISSAVSNMGDSSCQQILYGVRAFGFPVLKAARGIIDWTCSSTQSPLYRVYLIHKVSLLNILKKKNEEEEDEEEE